MTEYESKQAQELDYWLHTSRQAEEAWYRTYDPIAPYVAALGADIATLDVGDYVQVVNPPTFLTAFDNLETTGTKAVYRVFLIFLPISLLLLGCLALVAGRFGAVPGIIHFVAGFPALVGHDFW